MPCALLAGEACGYSYRVGAAIDLVESSASLETIVLRGGWRSNDSAMNYLRSW